VERVRTVGVAVIGAFLCWGATRSARRFAVADRLRPSEPRVRIPSGIHARLATLLDAAAVSKSPEEVLQSWLLATAVAASLGFGLAGATTAVAAIALVLVGAPVLVMSARGRRTRLLAAAVPSAIDRVAAELRAGGTIGTAIVGLAAGDDVLAVDFARLDARMQLGSSLDVALRAWARERPVEGVDAAAGALAVCASAGGRGADALDGLASSLRERHAVVSEAHALSAQARLSALVVGSAPIVYLAWSTLVDPHAVHTLFATSIGRVCVAIGLMLEALGGWWMRRIIRAGSVL
jgi:tight adherence protein B